MHTLYNSVFEPGFFSNQPVQVALVLGGLTAVVSALVGVFTVIRGQSFGGHALTDVSTAGGSGALLLGMTPLSGFVTGGLIGAGAMEMMGARRERGRDLATGIVLGAATGLSALFLYLDTTAGAVTGATQQILFGSIFLIDASIVPYAVALGAIALALVTATYRPLVLSCVNTDLASARGAPVRLVGVAYMAAMALAVGLSSLTIGTVLSTVLLVGPAATALRLTGRMGHALPVAGGIGVITTWVGVLLAYDSYYWGAGGNGWPVSFFVVAAVFASYLLAGLPSARARSRRRRQSAGIRGGGSRRGEQASVTMSGRR